ncbi:glycosyltransferase [Pontibacter pudoricolor]|uniref:glycosyltransferase n=1 Tax=Pontibacter pudoricolor TaxID=2694930 RepID=UPI001391A1B4|nr:glycosyltransferase [Pontibacter pudoricolor]
MKVLHVSTYRTGGAGIAAYRLHKGLQALGVASVFLYLDNETANITRKPKPPAPPPPSLYKRVKSKILLHLFSTVNNVSKPLKEDKIEGDYEAFTSPLTDYDITLHPAYQDADIINLHWVSDFLDFSSFFFKNTKPVVWTLHDLNPVKGGFHYSGDAACNKQLNELDARFLKIKYEALLPFQDLHVVALSKWLFNISSQSSTLKKFNHTLIPNGIDTEVFMPLDRAFSRKVLGLPADKEIILFVSEKLSVLRKGFDLLLEVIDKFEGQDNVLFCAVGISKQVAQKNIFYLDAIRDERLMAVAYAACDVFVIPSREDNLPNVMMESLACGTPVVATPVGGIPDVVIDNFNGVLAKDISADALYDALITFFDKKDSFDSEQIRKDFVAKYTVQHQAAAYKALYQQMLTRKRFNEQTESISK